MALPKRNAKGRFVKGVGTKTKKRRNPASKTHPVGRMCPHSHVHHQSKATANRAGR